MFHSIWWIRLVAYGSVCIPAHAWAIPSLPSALGMWATLPTQCNRHMVASFPLWTMHAGMYIGAGTPAAPSSLWVQAPALCCSCVPNNRLPQHCMLYSSALPCSLGQARKQKPGEGEGEGEPRASGDCCSWSNMGSSCWVGPRVTK